MAYDDHREVLSALLSIKASGDVRRILVDLGDHDELGVPEQFHKLGYTWRFYGENDSNLSTINLGSRPGRSLTERITNGIDAVIEKRMLEHAGDPPASPIAAVGQFFGRPPSTADNGQFKWKEYDALGVDRLVKVVLSSGDTATDRTVDVVDSGIGIQPADFATTILSLQKGNKIKKPYLVGAFGQGGSASIGFCKYALIVSRHTLKPDVVGFTVIKQKDLPEPYRWPAFVYLALAGEAPTVPFFKLDGDLDLYPYIEEDKPEGLGTGTLVRHFGYRLAGLEKTLSPATGNLYHLLQHTLFDPLLPFRVIDLSDDRGHKDERITGSRNRLMAYTQTDAKPEELTEDEESGGKDKDGSQHSTGTQLRHFVPREMVKPVGEDTPSIGVEYWVPLNYRKVKDKVVLRNSSNELFVDRNHPIVGTLTGQNQGELGARILRDLGLSMLSRHMVLHIDATNASSAVRQQLFTSTREGFRDGPVLTELIRVIKGMLEDDDELKKIEQELTESILAKESSETSAEVKKEIAQLLREAGIKVGETGEVLVAAPGDKEIESPTKPGKKPKRPAVPLATLPFPDVTYLNIVYPQEILRVPKADNHSVRIETDANFRYDRENRIAIRAEPAVLEIASKSELSGGRMHWRLRSTESAKPGDTGKVIVTLTRPDGSQLTSQLNFEILYPRIESAKVTKGLVPAFQIVPIDPESEREDFDRVWPDRGELDVHEIAYKAEKTADKLTVYYSKGFAPYGAQMAKVKTKADLAARFDHNYKVWIGYHAIIQHQQRAEVAGLLSGDDDQLDALQERERAMVAEMQAKQAMRMAELQAAAAKASLASE